MIRPVILAIAALAFVSITTLAQSRQRSSSIVVGNARFTVITPELVRIEFSKTNDFVNAPSYFAINRTTDPQFFSVATQEKTTTIETSRIRIEYTPDGRPFHQGNLRAIIKRSEPKADVVWMPGSINHGNLGGTIATLDGVDGAVPVGDGLLSREGWFLLDDSDSPLLVDGWAAPRPTSAGVDWFLFGYDQDYKAAMQAFTKVAGRVPLPRAYTLGSWYSRYWPYTSKEYKKIVDEYTANDFPLDVLVLDMDWHREGWTGWSWNRELLPDAEKLLDWLHQKGLHVTLNLHPSDGVGAHEDRYEDFMRDLGADASTHRTLPFDAGNKRYMEALFEKVHAPLEKDGVDFWWLDWQQFPFTRSLPKLSNLSWLNFLYYRHTARDGKRGVSFSRWAGWGDHRHPIHFSGDASTSWDMLAFEVPFTAASGNVGLFFWSHDIGGHTGERNEEAFVRWAQFGAMSAALRLHSTRNPELDRRPWAYSDRARDAIRAAAHLRSRLFPYIYSSIWDAHRNSFPFIRPMYLSYPGEEAAYHQSQQYLLGDDLLVAPITTPGGGLNQVAQQVVWIPHGDWFNWFTGERMQENTEHLVAAGIVSFPLYARGGRIIPMRPYSGRMTTDKIDHLVLRVFPGPDHQESITTLYEDDGLTYGYEKGEKSVTSLVYRREGDRVSIQVKPPQGSYPGAISSRPISVELAATQRARQVLVDGHPVKITYDLVTRTNRIDIPRRSVIEGCTIDLDLGEAPQDEIKREAQRQRISDVFPLEERGGKDLKNTLDELQGDGASASLEAFLAASGIGVVITSTSPVMAPKMPRMVKTFQGHDSLMSRKTLVRVFDKVGAERRMVKEASCEPTALGRAPCELNIMPLSVSADSEILAPVDRYAEVKFEIEGRHVMVHRNIDHRDPAIGLWQVIGPFPYSKAIDISRQTFRPEVEQTTLSNGYRGLHGRLVKWSTEQADELGIVDLSKSIQDEAGAIIYALAFVESDRNQKGNLLIHSDDGVEAWIDREKVHSHNVFRPISEGPDRVPVFFKKGQHRVLIKISNKNGGGKFKVSVETPSALKLKIK